MRGIDFDCLEPADPAATGRLPLNSAGELSECVLGGDLPCLVEAGGQRRAGVINFVLDLRHGSIQLAAAPRLASGLVVPYALSWDITGR